MTVVHVGTVTGVVPVEKLGRTLVHEHLVADFSVNYQGTTESSRITHTTAAAAWILREDPYSLLDNCRLDDPAASAEELALFGDAGGRSVVELTSSNIGRDPVALKWISERSGLNVIMGSGWYVEATHPPAVRAASIDGLVDSVLAEFRDGVGSSRIRPGVIGEVGVTTLTSEEEKALRAAARVQIEVGVPLFVHLHGWGRLGNRVLDVICEEGARESSVVLSHMNPSGHDREYQFGLAERGAWIAYDMIGMGFYHPDRDGQAPSPEQDAAAVADLISHGFEDRLLLSHDVYLKSMWTRNGGNGFNYIGRHFLDRLTRRFGVAEQIATSLLDVNPSALFATAANT